MKKRLIEYLKAFNEKLHNFLLNPLSILLIIIITIWLMRTNYTLPLTDVYIHLSFLIVCISFYTYHLATNDFIRDLLILGTIKDFKNREYYNFSYFNYHCVEARKGYGYPMLICFTLWCYFGYMYSLIYSREIIEMRYVEEWGDQAISFTALLLPVVLTILFNLYHRALHIFFYSKNIYKADNFLPIEKIFKSHHHFSGGEYESESEFEKRIIQKYSMSAASYLKNYFSTLYFDEWERFKFWIAIILIVIIKLNLIFHSYLNSISSLIPLIITLMIFIIAYYKKNK